MLKHFYFPINPHTDYSVLAVSWCTEIAGAVVREAVNILKVSQYLFPT
jgi:hypothetical protein